MKSISVLWQNRHILLATTWVELRKRYAGTILGPLWLFLYPAMFLGVYMFLYMVVFKVRFPDISSFSYVVLVFCGLVPYLALMETASSGAAVIRQNIHLVKNVMIPIELIPARVALIALVAQIPGLLLLMLLVVLDDGLGLKSMYLPLVLLIQFVFLLGIGFLMASLGGLFPDLQSAINVILIFLLFISPIAFPLSAAPAEAQLFLKLNPVTHLIQMFRGVLLNSEPINWVSVGAFVGFSLVLMFGSLAMFRRFKAYIVDHE